MNIVWFSWKDINHPLAGGAETVSTEIRKRLVLDGHSVRLITSRPKNSNDFEIANGVEIYRTGGKYSVYIKAHSLYKLKKMGEWADITIDEMNTLPFGVPFYKDNQASNYLLTYQLARSVWFYQMVLPLSFIGFLLEPIYLKLISKKYRLVLTESKSTKDELIEFGFIDSKIKIFRIGMELPPAQKTNKKENSNTILYLGAFRKMKRTLHAVKAFEIASDSRPGLTMV
jgi:glycosyltransferase involved in cell wall biosynthesis